MSGGTYLLGVVALAAIVVPVCLAARSLRVRFLPEWSGPLAFLATSVIAVALLEAIAQLAGTFGLLERIPLIVVLIAVCTAIVVLARRGGPAAEQSGTPSRGGGGTDVLAKRRTSSLVAVVVVAVVVLPWLARTISQLRTGIGGYDSLNYHLPFAGRFFQTGRVTSLYFTFPGLDTAFHPANDELVHAIGMVATRRDVLSPVINLGWLGLALLAAWCAHSQRAVKIMTVAAVGVLLAPPLFVSFSGGRATNDISGVALFVASAALLLHSKGRRAAVAVAAVAAGLALGTKLTMAIPVLALTVGVIAIAAAGTRKATAATWLPFLVVTGGFWYLRNLVRVGSPVPALDVALGPVSLPSATADAAGRYRSYSVAHYLADFGVWQHWFVPGLRQAFGLAWPVILGLAAAGLMLALVRGDLLVRVLGIVGVVSFVGYVFTPASAGGASGRPVLFASDTRFALPALVLGMLLLPRLVPRTSSVGRLWLPALLGIALLNDLGYAFSASIGFATLAGFVEVISVGVIVVLLIVWSTRPARTLAAVGCGLLVVGIAGGWLVERAYVRNRYTNVAQHIPYGSAPRDELAAIYAWVDGVSGARIALNGLGISYPLFGRDLSNHVQYVGHRGSHGAFTEVRSCNEWRRLLNNGHYDYVVISPDARDRSQPRTVAWTRSDPAAVPVVEAGKAVVFRVDGSFDPSTCPAN